MRSFFMLALLLCSLSVWSQTHTNRGGSGPDEGGVIQCSLENYNAKKLQLKYIEANHVKIPKKKKVGEDQIEVIFRDLILMQNLKIDLKLVGEFKFPDCKTCLSDKKKILVEWLELVERRQDCSEFDKKHDLIPLIKNIITYGE